MTKVILVILLLGCVQCIGSVQFDNPIFGYISKYGIPAAKRVKKLEDNKMDARIVGGKPSSLGQQPYQAGLIASIMGTSDKSFCGGSLITADRILTAAHCWYDGVTQAWMFEVVLGSVWLFSGGTRVNTSAVSTHPKWDPSMIRNDIAVVYLPNKVSSPGLFLVTISPIAVPSTTELNKDFVGSRAVASGFGLTEEDDEITGDQRLNYVKLKIITNDECSLSYPDFIYSSNICTSGQDGATPCRGDSGGPLVVKVDGRKFLIGITSFGSTFGCESNFPAVYTRVTSYLGFIYQHVS